MKEVYIKSTPHGAQELLERVSEIKDRVITVHADYETFYGFGFGDWLEKQLQDIPHKTEVTGYDCWYGFDKTFKVTIL